jgi:hypothetical protein
MRENGTEVIRSQFAIDMETELSHGAIDAFWGISLTGLHHDPSGVMAMARAGRTDLCLGRNRQHKKEAQR